MYTSDLEQDNSFFLKKRIIRSLAASVFCLILALVYNHFGHGVHSVYMDRLFLFPLLMGSAFYLILYFTAKDAPLSDSAFYIYSSSILTLSLGSLLKGIFEIAGTGSSFLILYWSAGILLAAVFVILQVISIFKAKRKQKLSPLP